jgi:putative phosphotransacetylase
MERRVLIPVEIVPSHVHLSARAWQVLFGQTEGEILRPLSQRGQVVYRQTVKVVGKNSSLKEVHVLGGARKQTQVELTEVEAAALGIKPVWRLSGRLSRSSGCKLVGPKGRLSIRNGVIVPVPHLHLSGKEAQALALRQGQEVELKFVNDREVSLKAVVRVHPSFRAALHLTPDLATKLWLGPGEKTYLKK